MAATRAISRCQLGRRTVETAASCAESRLFIAPPPSSSTVGTAVIPGVRWPGDLGLLLEEDFVRRGAGGCPDRSGLGQSPGLDDEHRDVVPRPPALEGED